MAGKEGIEPVRFGTDGWRAIIAREFTFDNVGRAASAIGAYLHSEDRPANPIYNDWGATYQPAERGVVVGYDTRFLSMEFAEHVARVLADGGTPAVLADRFVPTPALSFSVVDRRAAMGVMLTSSHNPPEYSGLKIKAAYGGSAPKAVTDEIEARLPDSPPAASTSLDVIERVDLITPYMARIRSLIEPERLTACPVHVVIDSMFGSAQGLVAQLLGECGVSHTEIRGTRDVLFGGVKPEPLEVNLAPLRETIQALRGKHERMIGVVTDGDGDRVSAMDESGVFIDAHRTYALLLRYLVEERGWTGPIVVSFNLSDMVRRMADAYGLEIIEIPIGFRYAAEHIIRRDILIAGEESGSLAIRGHIPERDGVLCSLLLAELVTSTGTSPGALIADLQERFGPQVYRRRDIEIETRVEVVESLLASPPDRFADRSVRSVETLDGIKFRFADGWLLFRASGTEPILRMYCEMQSEADVSSVLENAEFYARGVHRR